MHIVEWRLNISTLINGTLIWFSRFSFHFIGTFHKRLSCYLFSHFVTYQNQDYTGIIFNPNGTTHTNWNMSKLTEWKHIYQRSAYSCIQRCWAKNYIPISTKYFTIIMSYIKLICNFEINEIEGMKPFRDEQKSRKECLLCVVI